MDKSTRMGLVLIEGYCKDILRGVYTPEKGEDPMQKIIDVAILGKGGILAGVEVTIDDE